MLEVTGDASSEDERRENYNNSELENNNVHGAVNVSGKAVAYNKREMYFTNREMIAKLMDKSLPHVLFKTDSKPTSCVWCCRKKHDQPANPKHSRHGCTTKYQCPVCMVSLCRIKRFDGRSCHELFHSLTAFVDYCTSEMDAMVHVVLIKTSLHLPLILLSVLMLDRIPRNLTMTKTSYLVELDHELRLLSVVVFGDHLEAQQELQGGPTVGTKGALLY
jgi:hypothetical protein